MSDTNSPEPQQSTAEPDNTRYHILRIRRRSLAAWMGWLIWLIALVILLEYAIASFREHEQQAGIIAGAIFVGLLIAGIIIEVVRSIEIRSPYYYDPAEDAGEND